MDGFVFKKALQVVATFGLLLASYAGYDRVFALVATQIQSAQVQPVTPLEERKPKTLLEAIELAVRAFGADHWSTNPSKEMFRFYNAERGYWMYAKKYEREKDGKLLIFSPFALIWVSRDGKDLKTATSDKAYVLLDQPFDLMVKPGGGEMRVVNARLEGNVRLRDDKGTANPDDDLRVSGKGDEGLTYVEYDEAKQRITHDSFVTIEDGDMRVSGKGIEIVLRPKETGQAAGTTKPVGFDGAQTIFLKKDVHILIKDVGRSGVMPGTAPAGPKQGARVPLDLRCDGLARFDLPKPRPPLSPRMAGPPAPPLPTFAEFDRNVEVVRGKLDENPERMLSDHLRLTFLPNERDAAPAPGGAVQAEATPAKKAQPGARSVASADGEDEDEAPAASGPLASLALREAHATGHAVELISPAQGVKVRQCNELIYKKVPGEKPGETDDETYLRTDLTQKLLVEKLEIPTEGPDKGKVVSVTQVRCVDAKIFQNGAQSDMATIVARGPGILETRPALDKPVARTAVWNDELIYRPTHNEQGELRKQIELTDSPKFHDVAAQTTLDARRIVVVYLRPKAAETAGSRSPDKPKAQGSASAADSFEIDKLVALEDVHLNSPGRYLTAVDRLDAWFQPAPAAPPAQGAPAAQPAPEGNSKFIVANDPFAEDKPAAPAQQEDPKAAEKPADPDVFVKANRVWANILMRPSDEAEPNPAAGARRGAGAGKTKGELQRVYLTGAVSFHQDPAPGESKGTDITGESCHGLSAGNGLWQFQIHDQEPTQDKIFPNGPGARRQPMSLPPARVANKDMTIEGPTIGLDQTADKAWVVGPGRLVMLTERDLLSDKETASASGGAKDKTGAKVVKINTAERPPAQGGGDGKGQGGDKAKAPAKKVPVTITWTTEMDFYGQSKDPSGRPTARAEFFSDPNGPPSPYPRFKGPNAKAKDPIATIAETDNGLLVCQDMKVYFDRPIKLAKLKTAPGAKPDEAAEPEPKHDIDLIECFDNVLAIARKVDENHRLVQQQRVEGNQLEYNKVTGNFRVPGAGVVKYWNVKGEGQSAQPGSGSPLSTPPRTITRTAAPAGGRQVAGRTGVERRGAELKKKGAEAKKAATPRLPLEQTVIKFDEQMQGRFLPGKEGEREPRTADFFGNVEALHAPVADTQVKLSFDNPPPDFAHITAKTMRLISEPPAADAPPNSPSRTYMQAFDNAFVRRDDATIQADKVTYDSEKDLFWAYGYEGRQVSIRQFKGIGQTPSVSEGRAAYYVHKSGEAQIIDPQQFQLADLKTGTRPMADKAGVAKRPVRPKRGRVPNQNNVERRTFNGK